MTSLFQQIEKMVPTLGGWCTVERAQLLAASVLALRPNNCTLIGVWSGRDAFAMALACQKLGTGAVHCIDPWAPSASKDGQTGEHLKWWSEADHEVIYQAFLKKTYELGLQNVIRTHRMTSDEYEPTEDIQLMVIDGNHGPTVLRDAERYSAKVPVGGLCLLEDVNWPGGSVVRAINILKGYGFTSLYRVDDAEMFQRQK